MLIPATYQVALFLMIVAAVCWGSWAVTQKMAGSKWRFELYYIDFALGTLIGALLICFTAGSIEGNEITFLDSLVGISLRKTAIAMAAGLVFNLANVLIVTSISVSGMSVAFPISMSIATILTLATNYFLKPQGSATMLFTGLLVLMLAVIFGARAYRMLSEVRRAQQVTAEAEAAAALPEVQASLPPSKSPRVRKTGKSKAVSAKGVVLSVIAGFIMAGVLPLVDSAREGDLALSPYSTLLFFSIGLLFTSSLVIPFLMNFPVEGSPLGLKQYLQGSAGWHLLGVAGGMLWIGGLAAYTLAASVPTAQNVGPVITQAAGQGATILAALWGVVVWKEYSNSGSRATMQLMIMFVMLALGLALTSLASLY